MYKAKTYLYGDTSQVTFWATMPTQHGQITDEGTNNRSTYKMTLI